MKIRYSEKAVKHIKKIHKGDRKICLIKIRGKEVLPTSTEGRDNIVRRIL